jgi:hypothetical protein
MTTINNNIEKSSIGTFIGGDYNPASSIRRPGSKNTTATNEVKLPSIRMIVGSLVAIGAGLAALSNANGAWDLIVKITHFVW